MEPDNVDDAPEPDVDESAAPAGGQAPAEQKITTKFLTKYERGKFVPTPILLLVMLCHSKLWHGDPGI